MHPNTLAISLVVAALALGADAALSIQTVSHVSRPSGSRSGAKQISGITWVGGNLFYAVDDGDNKLYPITLKIDPSDGSLAQGNIEIGTGVYVSGANDMEGCAFDPASGHVWISEEPSAMVREVNPATGEACRRAPVPPIMRQYYGNFSLEALTISGDGLTMWTCNEEALKPDGTMLPGVGSVATKTAGSTVRLTKFTRQSVYDGWAADGQWAYLTEPVGTDPDWASISTDKTTGAVTTNYVTRSGVSGLCALPDGTLLALERRCYEGGFYPDFQMRIFEIDFTGATDISGIASLTNSPSYKRVGKRQLWEYHHGNALPNYEGICLGPSLADGSTSLVLVGDGGSSGEEGIFTLKLSGLGIRTVNFEKPECGVSSIAGGPYRFAVGDRVEVSLNGMDCLSVYTNNATAVTNVSWTLANSSRGGDGTSASFTVSENENFRWVCTDVGAVSTPIDFAESFERHALGAQTKVGDVARWTGDGEIVAGTGGASSFALENSPMPRDPHTKVLLVDSSVSCDFPCTTNGSDMVEMMVSVMRRQADEADDIPADALCVVRCDENGVMRLKCGSEWVALSDKVYDNGDWVRVSFKLATNDEGESFIQPRIDGESCKTAFGVHSPYKATSPGAWYPAMKTDNRIAGLDVRGSVSLDDVIKTVAGHEPELPEGQSAIEGVPLEFLRIAGDGLDPQSPAAQPRLRSLGYTAGDVYFAGLDPIKDEPFNFTGMRFLDDNRIELAFNGIDRTRSSYGVYHMEALGGEEHSVPGSVEVDEENYTTIWTSDDPIDTASGFYITRIENQNTCAN